MNNISVIGGVEKYFGSLEEFKMKDSAGSWTGLLSNL